MPLKNRPLERDGNVLRDANLIIVASEDRYAVKQYLARFRTRRVQFKVIETDDCRSDPKSVLARLDKFKEANVFAENDTLWLCIDRDNWKPHILAEVLSECMKKGYDVALSNPCFELWLLLHYQDIGAVDFQNCEAVAAQIKSVAGGYNKNKCCQSMHITSEMVELAIKQAKSLDVTDGVLPEHPMTRFYLVIELLKSRESIVVA